MLHGDTGNGRYTGIQVTVATRGTGNRGYAGKQLTEATAETSIVNRIRFHPTK